MKTKYSVTLRRYSKDNKRLFMSFFRTTDINGKKIKRFFARGYFDFEKEYFYVSYYKGGMSYQETEEDIQGIFDILEEFDMNEIVFFK